MVADELGRYETDKTFRDLDYNGQSLDKREFDSCHFVNCNFSQTVFTGSSFINCSFSQCNLSMVKFQKSSLSDVAFQGCKLMGADFSTANDFTLQVRFKDCILDYATFSGKPMKKTSFRDCRLQEVNFSGTDLAQSVFQSCDLSRAQFNRTNLSGADLSGAMNLSIDPEINTLNQARIALHALPGLLERHKLRIED